MRKVGLFGGTFDPPHRAHVRMALAFAAQIGLDEVVLIPAGDPYHKVRDARTAAADRLAMCALAVAAYPALSVSNIDIVREGATYTYDTVRIFRQTDPAAQWWWLIGSDSLQQITTWHRYQDLLRLTNLAVAWRGTDTLESLSANIRALVASGEAAARRADATGQIRFLDLPPEDISSTDIRARLRAGAPTDDSLDAAVADYARSHRLYLD